MKVFGFLAFSFFISLSKNLKITSLLEINTVSTDETRLIINYRSFLNL